jgi:hypothetical protein
MSTEIIIKGGSVALSFDDTIFSKDPDDPYKYSNPLLKVVSVSILGPDGEVEYPCEHGLIVIRVLCG